MSWRRISAGRAMLDVQHLEVRYGPTEVLRDVSFTVPANTIIALLGGNGSGKTTVLNAVSGLVAPRAGTVRVAGEDATGASPHAMVMRGVVQIPQGREVFADMTVQDNLEVGAAVRQDKRAIRHDIDESYELFPALRARRVGRAGGVSGGGKTPLANSRG